MENPNTKALNDLNGELDRASDGVDEVYVALRRSLLGDEVLKSPMGQDDFDRLLGDCMESHGARNLLSISGVYEAVSEYFNDVVLERWEIEQGS